MNKINHPFDTALCYTVVVCVQVIMKKCGNMLTDTTIRCIEDSKELSAGLKWNSSRGNRILVLHLIGPNGLVKEFERIWIHKKKIELLKIKHYVNLTKSLTGYCCGELLCVLHQPLAQLVTPNVGRADQHHGPFAVSSRVIECNFFISEDFFSIPFLISKRKFSSIFLAASTFFSTQEARFGALEPTGVGATKTTATPSTSAIISI